MNQSVWRWRALWLLLRAPSGNLEAERSQSRVFTCRAEIRSSPAPCLQPNPAPPSAHHSTTPRKRWAPSSATREEEMRHAFRAFIQSSVLLVLTAPLQHDSSHRYRPVKAEADAPRPGPQKWVPPSSEGRRNGRADHEQQPGNIRRGGEWVQRRHQSPWHNARKCTHLLKKCHLRGKAAPQNPNHTERKTATRTGCPTRSVTRIQNICPAHWRRSTGTAPPVQLPTKISSSTSQWILTVVLINVCKIQNASKGRIFFIFFLFASEGLLFLLVCLQMFECFSIFLSVKWTPCSLWDVLKRAFLDFSIEVVAWTRAVRARCERSVNVWLSLFLTRFMELWRRSSKSLKAWITFTGGLMISNGNHKNIKPLFAKLFGWFQSKSTQEDFIKTHTNICSFAILSNH